jgi:hypothetical protein
MPRARRNKSRKVSLAHDRRAQDLPRNAEVATVEIDNPLGLEPGEKIVALRSIRNDPLGRLHSHHQIDEAQYRGGRAFQDDWEKAERGPRAVDPTREYVDGGQAPRADHRAAAPRGAAAEPYRARTRRRWHRAGA